jgi:predicted phage tail protein
MLRKLKLYGELASFVGHKEFEIQVHSLPQAISFLRNNFPDIEGYMNPKYYQVKIGNYEISKDELDFPIGQKDIHIVPVISGAGSGFRNVLIGGLLIGASFFFPGAGLFGTTSFAGVSAAGATGAGVVAGSVLGTAIGTGLSYIGAGLVLQGVGEMLYPTQDPTFEDNPQISFNFSGTQNTARAGTPVPIVYGEIFTGSVVISGDVDTEAVQV